MVRHIVLFKLKKTLSQEEKLDAMERFKKAIGTLPAKIPVIRKIEVGLSINPDEEYDIALNGEFDSLDDVYSYTTHPEHVEAAKILAGLKESRACTDYEF